ncbi:quinoprotein relay system zinc metallohydrolase 1 [Limnobacter sp.]|uniref:quinoprotein relay system zinc metallohydrolase 1 n=1 Tax=Limnobacter sp. TaxID=2003368 RepID=UPI00351727BA
MRKRALALALWLALAVAGQTVQAELPNVALPEPNKDTLDYGLKATRIAKGWYVIAGANDDFSPANGCNIINTGFYVDDTGVWVINTGTSRLYGEQQKALIGRVAKGKPIVQVIALNLHPDYFLGNQAYEQATLAATRVTLAGMRAEANMYEDNLYRLCGDWMKATQAVLPSQTLQPSALKALGNRPVQALELKGHTDSDLVLFDPETRVLWAGGLVFYQRIATTPHAKIKPWIESLKTLKALKPKVVVPSHGPVSWGTEAIDQTLDYLTWLDQRLTDAARMGADLNDVMRQGVPERFKGFAAYPAEFYRNVTHLYPAYEQAELGGFK